MWATVTVCLFGHPVASCGAKDEGRRIGGRWQAAWGQLDEVPWALDNGWSNPGGKYCWGTKAEQWARSTFLLGNLDEVGWEVGE